MDESIICEECGERPAVIEFACVHLCGKCYAEWRDETENRPEQADLPF